MSEQNPFKNPKPFYTGDVFKTPNLKNISYSSFDYYSVKDRVIEYIKKNFEEDFNDFTESDLGIMLIEIWAYMADMLSFKLDMVSNEMFLDTVSQRKNLVKLAKLVGYQIKGPQAATCRISVSIPSPYNFNVYIPSGYSIFVPSYDNLPLYFELYVADENWNPIKDEDIVIPAGSITNLSIIGVEGTSSIDTFTSDGSRHQSFSTNNNSVIENSIEVFVNNQKWTKVDFFTEQDNGLYYKVNFENDYTATIMFSDDIRGRIPPNGSQIVVNYRNGGGTRGNISVNKINQTANISSTQVPSALPISISNYTQGSGGVNLETIDEIKYNLPLWLKSQDRAVTGEDYTVLAENFYTPYNGSIGKSIATLRNSGCAGNIIDIYVLQKLSESELTTANSILKNKLKEFIESKKCLTDYIVIKDAAQVYQNIAINVKISSSFAKLQKDIEEKISEKMDEFFKLNKWYIGKSLNKQDLLKELNSISNDVSIDVVFLENNQNISSDNNIIKVDFWKIIRPGIININIDVGG